MTEAAGTLQVGQTVVVREHQTFGVVVAVVPNGEPGHEVVEVGADCLVLAEPATGTRTRIPWYLVSVEGGSQPGAPAPTPRAQPAVTGAGPADGPTPGGPQPDAVPA
jgi:hypothetical protein